MASAIHAKKIFSLVTLVLVFLLSVLVVSSASGVSQLRADWLWDDSLGHAKLADEPANTEPWTYGVDCVGTYNSSGLSWCVQNTPVGKIANNTLIDGHKGTHPFNTFYGFIAPSIPSKPDTILTYSSPTSMGSAHMVQYSTYKPGNLKYVERYGLPTIKEYQYQPYEPTPLKLANNQVAPLVARSIAFSNNGQYMVAGLSGGGIVVYNTSNWNGKVISVDVKLVGFDLDKKGANLAISDDGQFVAANVNLGSGAAPQPTLRVYDTRTCLDQTGYVSNRSKSNGCEFRDVWTGEFRGLKHPAVKDVLGVEYPRQIRFSTNNIVTFKLIHSRTSPTAFSVSKHNAVADMKTEPTFISLLGMGDSYISGEGAFNYRTPTDSKANKCHNSLDAYPYQKGLQHYPVATSVACSGAVIEDVETTSEQYIGQSRVNPQIAWRDRSNTQTNKVNNYFLPGYKGQVLFTQTIKPKTVLLSVGGNDVNFANIVTSCVDNVLETSCYPYYKERRELMVQMQSQYTELKALYTKVKASSQGNVYVVGYPEIAKPGGNCRVNVRLDADEVQFSSDLVVYLNKVIKNAASDAGVFYVDNQKALYGFRLCEDQKGYPGVNGVTKGNDTVLGLVGNESFHPTRQGHTLLGHSILAKTNNFTASMPSKTNLGAPEISNNDPLLAGKKPSTINYNRVIWKSVSETPMRLKKGGKYLVKAVVVSLAPSPYNIVLKSDPVTLYSGTYDPNKDVFVTIPESTPAGFHTLHIYGVDENSESVDVAQVVYVSHSEADFDGDGTPNDTDSCNFIANSGIDEDADGLDDACDTVGAENFVPEIAIPDDTQADFSALLNGAVEPTVTDSLLTEYIEPKQETLAPKSPLRQTELPKTATISKTSSISAPAFYGQVAGAEVLSAAYSTAETAIKAGTATITTGATGEVLSKTSASADTLTADATKQAESAVAWWVVAVACALIAVGVVIFSQTRRNKA